MLALVVGIVAAFGALAQNERGPVYGLANEGTDVASGGTVRLADNITSMVIHGQNGTSARKVENGVIKLPVGEYRVPSWTIARTDDTGARWEMIGMLPPGRSRVFATGRDAEPTLPFGEPVYCTIEARRKGSVYSFEQRLEGRHGERITLTRNGSRPPAPKLRIRSRDGTYDQSLSFAYG
jgi:hypothetical protein